MKHCITNSMSLAEVCGFIAAADHILGDDERFELSAYNASNAMVLVGSTAGKDSPRPVGAFKIASTPIVRE